jgi:hypothetical protein
MTFGGALSNERSGLSFVSLCHYSLQWSVSIYINYIDQSQGSGGQGYITTNSQSVSMSWYRAQFRTIDQSLLSP